MSKLIINYVASIDSCIAVNTIADSYTLDYAKSVVDSFNKNKQTSDKDASVSVSTECAITAFRVMVKRGLIKPEEIMFMNERGEECPVNHDGCWLVQVCPFNSVYESMLMELI